jgi:hypothetical protein
VLQTTAGKMIFGRYIDQQAAGTAAQANGQAQAPVAAERVKPSPAAQQT